MTLRERWGRISFAAAVCLVTSAAHAQYPFDVPFVPTPPVVVEEILRLANVGPDDFVMDLGSGDGRILIAAARKFGARGIGVDLDPDRIEESLYSAQIQGVSDRVTFEQQDLFKFDLGRASVITMYLLPSVNMKLRDRLLGLKPGTRIVSHDFDMEDWQPDQKSTVRKNVFLWIVPAKVEGRWRTTVVLPAGERSYDIEIRQKFQDIDGLARYGDKKVAGLWNPRLRGDRVSFVIVDDSGSLDTNLYFEGRVSGDVMEGTIQRGIGRDQTQLSWRATRVSGAN
jgi:SAM-dependent methyltransferase